MRTLVLALLLLALPVVAGECQMVGTQIAGHAVENEDTWRARMVEFLHGVKGVTFCREDGGSFSMIKPGLSEIERAEVTAHEAKHVEQHQRFKTCAAFQEFYRTPLGTMKTEAEAFHAGWCVAVAMGGDPVSLRALHLQIIQMYYVPGTPIFEIAQEFAKYGDCHGQ